MATSAPILPLEPSNILRYAAGGRLADEWIQTDNRSVLRQLGSESPEHGQPLPTLPPREP